jgi:hypothetical protein
MAFVTDSFDVAKNEILPVAIDVDAMLQPAETVGSVTIELTEETSGAIITGAIVGTPSVTGNTLSITINGTPLVKTNRYQLKALLVITPGQKVLAVLSTVTCT